MSIGTSRSTEHRARAAARNISHATLAVGLMLGLAFAYAFVRAILDQEWLETLVAARFPSSEPLSVGWQALSFIIFWMAAQAVTLGVALYAVWRTFGILADGDTLDLRAGRWLRRAGTAFAISAILMLAADPAFSLALSTNAPAGQRFITFRLGSNEILTFFAAGVLVALGHVLSLAAEVGEDNRQIV